MDAILKQLINYGLDPHKFLVRVGIFILGFIVLSSCGDLQSGINPSFDRGTSDVKGVSPNSDYSEDSFIEGSTSTGIGNPANSNADGSTSTGVGNPSLPSFSLNESKVKLSEVVDGKVTLVAANGFILLDSSLDTEVVETRIDVNDVPVLQIPGSDFGDDILFEVEVPAEDGDTVTIVVKVPGTVNEEQKLDTVAFRVSAMINQTEAEAMAESERLLGDSKKKNQPASNKITTVQGDFLKNKQYMFDYIQSQIAPIDPQQEKPDSKRMPDTACQSNIECGRGYVCYKNQCISR